RAGSARMQSAPSYSSSHAQPLSLHACREVDTSPLSEYRLQGAARSSVLFWIDRTRPKGLAAWLVSRGASFAGVAVGDGRRLRRATETTRNDSNAGARGMRRTATHRSLTCS